MAKKILIIRPDSIGDALLGASVIPYLARHFSQATISVVCQPMLTELYQACPHISQVIALDKKQFCTDQIYRHQFLGDLHKQSFDLVLNPVYSRELSMDHIATQIRAHKSIAFRVPARRNRFDFPFRYNRGYTDLIDSPGLWKSELSRYADLLDALKIKYSQLMPHMWIPQQYESFADDFFQQNNMNTEKTIAFFAGAQSSHRLYEKYGAALHAVAGGADFTVVVFGAQSDAAINKKNTVSLSSRVIDLSGKTTLLQTAALLKRCRLAFGAETGLAHMACAVGVNNVIVLGGGHFGRFMPYSPLTSSVVLPLSCFGCDWKCRYKKTYCVQDVDSGVLARALEEVLKKPNFHKPRIFLQDQRLYQTGWNKPTWQYPRNLLDMSAVDVIMI